MQFAKALLLAAPMLALASPVDLEKRQLTQCCYQTTEVNELLFITSPGSGSTLDTLKWCFLDVQWDANETDCEKLKRTISGYCDPATIFTKAVACPKA